MKLELRKHPVWHFTTFGVSDGAQKELLWTISLSKTLRFYPLYNDGLYPADTVYGIGPHLVVSASLHPVHLQW